MGAELIDRMSGLNQERERLLGLLAAGRLDAAGREYLHRLDAAVVPLWEEIRRARASGRRTGEAARLERVTE